MPSMTLTCAICNLPMHRGKGSRPQGEATHNACRRNAVTHGESGYAKGCRCGSCRAGKNAAMREYSAARRERDGISHTGQYKRSVRGVDPLATVICFACGEPLVNIRSTQARYPMHKKCRPSVPEWVRKGRENPRRAAFQARIDKAASGTCGNRVFTCGGCRWCGQQFVGIGSYCSRKCSADAKFKRRSSGKTFKISPRVRLGIYERDAWTCQLCRFPVDSGLHHTDNWSASLDHIIPQSHMILPDHSPSNLRLVHKMCNSMRGDGSNMAEEEFHRRINEHFEGVAA